MALPEKTQEEISKVYQSVAQYFSGTGFGEDYYKNPGKLTDLQKQLDDKLAKKEEQTSLVQKIISELKQQIEYKTSEVEMVKDQLLLYDLRIDQYDILIINIDKQIIPLIDEINVGIASVKTAYDNRVAAGCKSDLYWEVTTTKEYDSGIYGKYPVTIYTCKKNPSVRTIYPYYGAKYYRKPQNQDYGANIVTEFLGTISSGSTILGLVGEKQTTTEFKIGDKIVDNIDNPTIFPANNLPAIIGFGTTSLVGTTTSFGGTVSFGSTVIAHTGIGTTTDIIVGNAINLSNVLYPNTTVVGFGTTTIALTNVWDPNKNGPGSGGYISSTGQIDSLIISKPSIGSTQTGTFTVGVLQDYPSVILDGAATQTAIKSNFTLVRNTQITDTEFDYTNNPIDPVSIGIMGNSTVGLGHSLFLVNNGSPVGPFQWHQVRNTKYEIKVGNKMVPQEDYPEPQCGADAATYYPGNEEWPVFVNYTRGIMGEVISQASSYATEGQSVSVSYYTTFYDIGTTNTSQLNPSQSVCAGYATSITKAEESRDAILKKNIPKIQNLIASASALRDLRDKLESQAFSILQARIFATVEINKLNQNLSALLSNDYSTFEPKSYYFNPDTGKTSSSNLGVSTT